jgi:hypothetical protein
LTVLAAAWLGSTNRQQPYQQHSFFLQVKSFSFSVGPLPNHRQRIIYNLTTIYPDEAQFFLTTIYPDEAQFLDDCGLSPLAVKEMTECQ